MAHFTRPVEAVDRRLNNLLALWDKTTDSEKRSKVKECQNDLHEWVDDVNGHEGEVAIPVEVAAEVAFSMAPEILERDDIETLLPEGTERADLPAISDLRDQFEQADTIEDSERGFGFLFGGPEQVHSQRLYARATRWQPAEYETISHDVWWTLEYYPADNGGFGSARYRVETA